MCVGANFSVALEREHGIPPARLEPFFKGPFLDCIVGRRDLREMLAPQLVAWGWTGSVDELLEFWFRREHVVCPEVMAAVRHLRGKGHRCLLGTNQEKYRAAYMRREMRFEEEFDAVCASCDLGAAKPSAEFFHGVERRVGQPGARFLLIDDSEKNVRGAQAVGWDAVHYTGDRPGLRALLEAKAG